MTFILTCNWEKCKLKLRLNTTCLLCTGKKEKLKGWQCILVVGCGEIDTLIHHWWNVLREIWQILIKQHMHLIFDLVIPLWQFSLKMYLQLYKSIRHKVIHCSVTHNFKILKSPWTSLVAKWLRICLPMQGTRV